MRTLTTKAILSALSLVLVSTVALTPSTAQANVSETAIEVLCHAKAEMPTIAYHSEARRFGITRQTLRMLEERASCSGVPLGQVRRR